MNKITKKCLFCDNEFTTSYKCPTQKYCNKNCGRKYCRQKNKKTVVKKCENCTVEFTPGNKNGVFCSKKCGRKFREKKKTSERNVILFPVVNCPTCSLQFRPARSNQKFCCTKCYEKQKRPGRKPKKTARHYACNAWCRMNRRVKNYPSYVRKKIKVLMTREEFIAWACVEFQKFLNINNFSSPSIDRINPDGHYEISNIRVLSLEENTTRMFLSNAYRKGGINMLTTTIIDLCKSEKIEISDIIKCLSDSI